MSSRRSPVSHPSPDPDHGAMPPAVLEAVAERFRVLSAPSRLGILDSLLAQPMRMSDLADATGLSQSNLSRQVAELERAALVRRVRDGREVTVEIADDTLGELCALVCGSMRRQLDALGRAFGH